ncbi:UDP-2,3-diacylglucosamine diphosphatase [Aquisphaera insulae]|uniref:UDP-2,3-diacylglucosamine diphosphatase n=1 Tax=Aquisphaera insulae TaxID=2712864 RepID=UPI0013ED6C30|nr:UDP-2,3-diacylglucosamine diphosphatase [Aquisphaera insulae]
MESDAESRASEAAGASSTEPRYDCIVISDLHLGSMVCQAKLLEEFLIWACDHCRVLVINGDIFDDLNFKRLTKRHFACLKVIRRNSDRPDMRVIWVRGNHDGPADIVGHIVGVEILDESVFDNGQIRLLILHGDQFDTITTGFPLLTEIACGLFYYIQKVAPHRTARWIRRISKRFQRNSQVIERRASEYAASRGFRYVTCGHTHLPLESRRDGILYINSGTWTEAPPCPFVTVLGREIRLQYWPLATETVDNPSERLSAGEAELPPSGASPLPALG